MRIRVIVSILLTSSMIAGNAQDEMSAFQTGLLHYTNQDLDEAIVALYDAVAADPSNANAWFYRGLCREGIGEHSGALSDLNKAYKLDVDNVYILISRAQVLRVVGQRQRSINDFERVLYLSPEGPLAIRALRELGTMNIEQNSYREALENFDRLIELLPEDAEAFYYRGLCKGHNKDHGSAIADHSEAIELQPSFTQALEARAIQYLLTGKSSLACDDIHLSKELGSTSADDLIANFCE